MSQFERALAAVVPILEPHDVLHGNFHGRHAHPPLKVRVLHLAARGPRPDEVRALLDSVRRDKVPEDLLVLHSVGGGEVLEVGPRFVAARVLNVLQPFGVLHVNAAKLRPAPHPQTLAELSCPVGPVSHLSILELSVLRKYAYFAVLVAYHASIIEVRASYNCRPVVHYHELAVDVDHFRLPTRAHLLVGAESDELDVLLPVDTRLC
mmetsp:Transcript_12807/g.26125  ORF Transcript_12807/g.26125 Transcript_12807/m.26125 type:complete len:207 (-) Transcript_12807:3373-3993(-)